MFENIYMCCGKGRLNRLILNEWQAEKPLVRKSWCLLISEKWSNRYGRDLKWRLSEIQGWVSRKSEKWPKGPGEEEIKSRRLCWTTKFSQAISGIFIIIIYSAQYPTDGINTSGALQIEKHNHPSLPANIQADFMRKLKHQTKCMEVSFQRLLSSISVRP